jgi:hypothetical protein
MPIFSKRTLQRLINENASFMTKEQLLRHVNGLNRHNENSLSIEWEVVLLNAFNKLGRVTYEPALVGKSRPDLLFCHAAGRELLADIATVSDRGFHEENPVEAFLSELERMKKKYRLAEGTFSWKIGGHREGPFRDQKMKLDLPQKKDFSRIFDEKFHRFMKQIKANPCAPFSHIVRTSGADVWIGYNPGTRFSWGDHPGYTVAYSITRNPIYNALKRKSRQIKDSGYKGYRAIVLCDGGCYLFREKLYSPDAFRMREVVCKFLEETSSVGLVLIVSIQSRLRSPFHSQTELNTHIEFFTNSQECAGFADQLVDELAAAMPKPITDASGAVNHLNGRHAKEGISRYGGWKMEGRKIEISARALLLLLAGQISQERFLKDHRLIPTEEDKAGFNMFEKFYREGRLFEKANIRKAAEEDDDAIVFEFGDPDPAISRFVVGGAGRK